MYKMMLVLVVVCAVMAGCGVGASTVKQLKNNPGYSVSVKSNYGYQESLKIIKDEYAALLGYDLSCTIYSDMKIGECTFTNMQGIVFVASSKYIDKNSALVDFYVALHTSRWEQNISHIAAKLQ